MTRIYVAHILLVATKTAGKVETRIQLLDFARNDPAALNALKSVVADLDVGVLGQFLLFFPYYTCSTDG